MAISFSPPAPTALGDVRSEVGMLRRVLVHRPGAELDRLTPANAAGLLFDDVPRPERAREEHDALAAALRREGVEVLYLEDLLAQALGLPTVEVGALIGGTAGRPPLPNLMFVRDTSAWLGGELVLGALGNPVRRLEVELIERAYRALGDFAAAPTIAEATGIEGGDLFCLSERVALVGVGSRTGAAAVEDLAERLFATGFERVLALEVPRKRASIHLDCLLTQVDVDLLLVDRRVRGKGVVEMLPPGGPVESRIHPGIEAALTAALGFEMRAVEVADEREQWTLAANTVAVRPGRVVAYGLNERTNEALAAAGVEVLAVPGEELSRGRGGPRCLTCPLVRDAVPLP